MKRNKEWRGNKGIFIIKLIQVLMLLSAQADFAIMSEPTLEATVLFSHWDRHGHMLSFNRLTPIVMMCGQCAHRVEHNPFISTPPHTVHTYD